MAPERPFIAEGLAYGRGKLWVLHEYGPVIVSVDPVTLAVSRPARLDLPSETGVEYFGHRHLAFGHGYLWIPRGHSIVRVDPDSLEVRIMRINAPGGEFGDAVETVSVGPASIWVAGTHRETIAELDPEEVSVVRTLSVPRSYRGLAVGEHLIWMLDVARGGALIGLDAQTGDDRERIDLSGFPTAVASAGERVWATSSIGKRWEQNEDGHIRWHYEEPHRAKVVSARLDGGLLSMFQIGGVAWPHPFRRGLMVETIEPGEPSRVVRLDPDTGEKLAEFGFRFVRRAIQVDRDLWIVSKNVDGGQIESVREAAWLTRLNPETNLPITSVDLGEVEIGHLFGPWQPPPPDIFEQHFREAVEAGLSSHPASFHPETGDGIGRRSKLGPGRSLVEVRLRGTDPNTLIEVLFRDEARPECLFGLAAPVWLGEHESWDMSPDGAAMIFEINVFEEPPWLELPPTCRPDSEGITWIDRPA